MKIPPDPDNCQNCFCRSLTQKSREKICKAKIWVNYSKKHQQIFFLENKQIIILEQGVVMPLRSAVNVRQQSVDLMRAGDLLGIVNLFAEGERESFTVLPLMDSAGCMIPVTMFENFIRTDSDIAEAVIKQYSARYSRVVDNFVCKTLNSSEDRLKYAITQLKKNGVPFASHEEIALLSGLNRVTVTKKMSQILRDDIE